MHGGYRNDSQGYQRHQGGRGGAGGGGGEFYHNGNYAPPSSGSSPVETYHPKLNQKLIADYLRYFNEYSLKEPPVIVDQNLYNNLCGQISSQQSMSVVQEFLLPEADMDPSKMILKLCQVCFKGSHRFVPQDQGNKKLRVVDFMINNKIIFQFTFECTNNKIANRATAYESINLLFPKIYDKMLSLTRDATDPKILKEFEKKQSSQEKSKEEIKKQSDIFLKLFGCEFSDIEIVDNSGTLAGFQGSFTEDQTFKERVDMKMFSTISNNMLQKNAGRSLNFDINLTRKITAENSLDGEGRNEYRVEAVDNHAKKYFSASIICKNKNDAKNACGLKFIEKYASAAFKKIWDQLMKGIPMPDPSASLDSTSQSLNKSGGNYQNPDQGLQSSFGTQHQKVNDNLAGTRLVKNSKSSMQPSAPLNLNQSLGLVAPTSSTPMGFYASLQTPPGYGGAMGYPLAVNMSRGEMGSLNDSVLQEDLMYRPQTTPVPKNTLQKRYDTSAEPFYLHAQPDTFIRPAQNPKDEGSIFFSALSNDEDDEDKRNKADDDREFEELLTNPVRLIKARPAENNALDQHLKATEATLTGSGNGGFFKNTKGIYNENPEKGSFINNSGQLHAIGEGGLFDSQHLSTFSPFGPVQPKPQPKGLSVQVTTVGVGGIGAQALTSSSERTPPTHVLSAAQKINPKQNVPKKEEKNQTSESDVSVDSSFEREKRLKTGEENKKNDDSNDRSYKKSSNRYSESASEDANEDSVFKMFNDYVQKTLSPGEKFDLSSFRTMQRLKVSSDWKGTYLQDSELFAKVSEVLVHNGYRIECVCDKRNDEAKEFSFRVIIERLFDSKEQIYKAEAYADLSFTSKLMDYFHCFNYSVYLLLHKTFPTFAKTLEALTLRTALGLNADDKSLITTPLQPSLFKPADVSTSHIVIDRLSNHTLSKSVFTEQGVSHMDFRFDQPLSSAGSNPLQLASSKVGSNLLGLVMAKAVDPSDPTSSILESLGSQNLIEHVKNHLLSGTFTGRQEVDEELKRWNLLNQNFVEIFTDKIKKMEPWELISIFYHDDVKVAMHATDVFYESRIKKRDNFYDTVRKNMLDEDYASVANSFVHTIFKEAMDINYSGDFTLFKLHGKTMLIVQAKVQNNKLRKKLTSIVVLRLYWKELYRRCAVGDLGRNE